MFHDISPTLIAQAKIAAFFNPFAKRIIIMQTPTIAQIKKLARRPSVGSLTKLQDIVRGQDKRLDLIRERDINLRIAGRVPVGEKPKYITAARDVSRKLALQPGGSRAVRRLAERESARMQRKLNNLDKRIGEMSARGQVFAIPSKTTFGLAT
jgi:hypothetical protein